MHYENLNFEALRELLRHFEESTVGKLVSKLNPKLINDLKDLLNLMQMRDPRVFLVGRRGSGKSSFINAILGENKLKTGSVVRGTIECKWQTIEFGLKKIRILDSKGAGQGSDDEEAESIDQIKEIISAECPDIILFLCKAKEVDANIEPDLKFLNDVVQFTKSNYSENGAPIIALATQVDELDPADINEPPFEDSDKQENIKVSVSHLHKMFKKFYDHRDKVRVFPVCSYMRFKEHNLVCDRRWNVEEVVETIVSLLPDSAKLAMMKFGSFRELQHQLATRITNVFTAITGTIGAEPIPVADMPILTSLQVTMIAMIAAVGGRKGDLKTAKEFLVAAGIELGGAFTIREIARALVKLWPGYGSVISGGIAAGFTKVIGTAATKYFIDSEQMEDVKNYLEKNLKVI